MPDRHESVTVALTPGFSLTQCQPVRLRSRQVLESTGSTNSDLLNDDSRFSSDTRFDWVADQLVSWAQTAGRGQRGRSWHSDPDQCLTFSVRFQRRPAHTGLRLEGLSLWVVCVLHQYLREFREAAPHQSLRLKWPNDLVIAGPGRELGKVGGVLVETRLSTQLETIVIGVGLNLVTPISFLNTGREQSAWLEPHALQPVGLWQDISSVSRAERLRLADGITQAWCKEFQSFQQLGLAAYCDYFERHHVLQNALIEWTDADKKQRGYCVGITTQGGLRVLTEPDRKEFTLMSAAHAVRLV